MKTKNIRFYKKLLTTLTLISLLLNILSPLVYAATDNTNNNTPNIMAEDGDEKKEAKSNEENKEGKEKADSPEQQDSDKDEGSRKDSEEPTTDNSAENETNDSATDGDKILEQEDKDRTETTDETSQNSGDEAISYDNGSNNTAGKKVETGINEEREKDTEFSKQNEATLTEGESIQAPTKEDESGSGANTAEAALAINSKNSNEEADPLFPTETECKDDYGGKYTLCHATSSETNKYVKIEISCNALYGNGNAGHLSENGTTRAGHEKDMPVDENGLCPGESVQPEFKICQDIFGVGLESEMTVLDLGESTYKKVVDQIEPTAGGALHPKTGDVYYIYNSQKINPVLIKYDIATGTQTELETSGLEKYKGYPKLAFDADANLYTMNKDFKLYTIDITNGSSEYKGTYTGFKTFGGDMAFDSENKLFAVDYDGNFYVLRSTTKVAEYIGNIGVKNVTGLAIKDGKFYVSSTQDSPVRSRAYSFTYENVLNGEEAKEVADTRGLQVNDLASCPNSIVDMPEENQCVEGKRWAQSVVSFDQGTLKGGGNVLPERSDPANSLFELDSDFVSLGKEGELVISFDDPVLNVSGTDLTIYETTYESRFGYPEETADVYVSQNGTSWFFAGEVTNHVSGGANDLDISNELPKMNWFKYVKLIDTTNFAPHINSADGFDVNALLAVEGVCEDLKTDTAAITGYKFNDLNGNGTKEENEPKLEGWGIELYTDDGSKESIYTTTTNENGNYLIKLDPGKYTIKETQQKGWKQTTSPDICTIDLKPGEEAECIFGNMRTGSLTGHKYADLNRNGIYDETDYPLPNWPIHLCELPSQTVSVLSTTTNLSEKGLISPNYECLKDTTIDTTTNKSGEYFFDDLRDGHYKIWEDETPGYDIIAPEKGFYQARLSDGEVAIDSDKAAEKTNFDFFNAPITPELYLMKTNNWTGDYLDNEVENVVTYTIKVTAKLSYLYNVRVVDLLPEGFTYIAGSYTADSSLRGDLKAGNITTEPTYASPGTWELGDMEDGEVVTLTLKAKTAISVDPGLYKDLTWTQGSDSNENEILAQAETEGYVDENFSGTEVGVKEKPQPDEAKTEVKVNKKEIIEEVLGASTERGEVLGLPATGTITAILATLLVSLASGIILIVFGLLRKNKKMSLTRTARVTLISLLVLLAAGAMNFNKVDAAAALRVEDPISPANSEFSITFVLLDTESRPNTNVECYVKKPTSADYIKYQEVSLADGGNTDSCLVNNSVLTEDGTYYFNVKAVFSDETSITSESVSVKYDSKGPGKPRYIKKDKKNSCEYEVKFKTSSEGDTNYVEVYRSFNKEFTVNDSSKIKTISIGNDATYEFTDNLPSDKCGKKPYYAVRAFDEAGNPSNVRVEEITEETIIEKTVNSDSDSEVTTTEGQFIGAAGGLQSLTGTAGEQDQNQTGADQDQGDGAVLGTNEDEGNGNIRTDRERNSSTLLAKLVNALTSPVIYIPVIILAVLGLYLGAKKRLKNSQK